MICCYNAKQEDSSLSDIRKKLLPRTEYQEEYTNEGLLKDVCPINKRFVSAGVPTKGKPDYQPLEYDASEDILPKFRGESTSKSEHGPQPQISKLKSYNPTASKMEPPMPLAPYMAEVDSYSHDVHCPMPLELARKTASSIPLWIKEKLKPMEYKTRYDLTSSYQADYCGTQTKPRRICLKKESCRSECGCGNFTLDNANSACQPKDLTKTDNEIRLWNHVHSLLYRTTNNSTYLPPSTFGRPLCHPTKYHPNE